MRLKPDLKLIGAVALAAIGVSIAAAPKARADQDWQCGIILCMANPAGPTAAGPSCVSDMNELAAWLADPFHSWPTCAGMGGSDVHKAIFGDVYIYQSPTGQKTAFVIQTNGKLYITNNAPWIDLPTEANP